MPEIFKESALIEAPALAELLESGTANIRLVDASYGNPAFIEEFFTAKRIGNAVYFDIDKVADPAAELAHTVPSAEIFEKEVGALGISNDDHVIVYDQTGIFMSACRVWWMFRLFGHDKVSVLNGGLPYWESLGLPIVSGRATPPEPASFKADFRPNLLKSLQDIAALSENGQSNILDARAAERFSGIAAEAKPDLRSGHIPNSINTPFMDLLDTDGRLKSPDFLAKTLQKYNDKANVVSCGSGVTACVVALGLYEIGMKDAAIYDGSWSEWGLESSNTPVATG